MICVAGHQPNLYPYGGFFAKAASVDKFVLVDNTQYVKKQYHNRNRIKLADGSICWLSIPVRNAGHHKQPINTVEIDNTQNWNKKHKRTLFLNYKKSLFFDLYYPEFEDILSREWNLLADYNVAVIRLCLKLLDIHTPLFIASGAGIAGRSTDLILDMCRKTGADAYLHGKHSRDYVDFSLLEDAGIKNYVQDFTAVEYPQQSGGFTPNLSVLDIFFNCGNKTKEILLRGNKITEL